MVWHIIRIFAKKLGYLEVIYPSNRANQNLDYLLIFSLSTSTAGLLITAHPSVLEAYFLLLMIAWVLRMPQVHPSIPLACP